MNLEIILTVFFAITYLCILAYGIFSSLADIGDLTHR